METGNFLMPPLGFSDFERQSHHRDRKTVRRVAPQKARAWAVTVFNRD